MCGLNKLQPSTKDGFACVFVFCFKQKVKATFNLNHSKILTIYCCNLDIKVFLFVSNVKINLSTRNKQNSKPTATNFSACTVLSIKM